MRYITRSTAFIALMVAAQLGIGGTPPVIGTASSKGHFRVDSATVSSSATLMEGNTVETDKAGCELLMNGGARALLGAGSRGKVHSARVVLEKGGTRMLDGAFPIRAGGLDIEPDSQGALGEVWMSAPNVVRVSALKGSLKVKEENGNTILSLESGRTMEFETHSPDNPAIFRLTGKLVNTDGHYLLRDEASRIVVELQGDGLVDRVGKRVTVNGISKSGVKPALGASRVLAVSRIITAASTGISTTAVVLGVGVVSAAGTGLGLGVLQGEDDRTNTSR